ncbi:MAG: hypothetical protein ACM3IL_01510 [Deltaproteobacteria bacterium]
MREHLVFLETSSAAVKIAAWISLILGISGALLIIAGRIPGKTIKDAIINVSAGTFFFFFLYLIAKIADLLGKIINEIKKE